MDKSIEKKKNSWSFISSERSAVMGFAILWIMIFHSDFHIWGNPLLLEIQSRGNMGVDLFLLLFGIGLYYSAASAVVLNKLAGIVRKPLALVKR